MKIRWTVPAAKAVGSIQDYIAEDNPRAAWEVAQKIRQTIQRLATHPHLGRVGRVAGTYELVLSGLPYIVPYRVLDDEIQILTVFHSSRKWPEKFS